MKSNRSTTTTRGSTLDSQAIPAVVFAVLAIMSGAWKILDFSRDARVQRAERDALDEHSKLMKAIAEIEGLRVRLAQAEARLAARGQGGAN
jgi:hypothetical protein